MKPRTAIWCHPATVKWLCAQLPPWVPMDPQDSTLTFRGIPVKTSLHLPKFTRRWVPPSGRFWECEQSDRVWCEPLGLGRWEDSTEPYFLEITESPLPMLEFFAFDPVLPRGIRGYC